MKIKIIALGEKMPAWVSEGYQEYQKRLTSTPFQLELIELPIAKRGKNYNKHTAMAQEAKSIQTKLDSRDFLVVLDSRGQLLSTEQFAEKLDSWQQTTANIAIIIGGPDGIDETFKASAQAKISLSKMTLPHPIVRVVLAEQVYRAWSLLQGHPYHK